MTFLNELILKSASHLSILPFGHDLEAFYHLDEKNLELVDIFFPIQKLMTVPLLTTVLLLCSLQHSEYCGTFCYPNVSQSPYLRTVGEKLLPGIEVLWTGKSLRFIW